MFPLVEPEKQRGISWLVLHLEGHRSLLWGPTVCDPYQFAAELRLILSPFELLYFIWLVLWTMSLTLERKVANQPGVFSLGKR